MFLSFGKKSSCAKKQETPVEVSSIESHPGTSSNATAMNVNSRSTVQTTAGPLLSSSRFNSILDPSTMANVNSPGFTSRVVNCAVNGSSQLNGNGVTHQSKYSSVGMFPRVQLGLSTLPTLTPRNSQKIGRIPVRGRIAPPAISEPRRHSFSSGSDKGDLDKTTPLKRSPSFSSGRAAKDSDILSLKCGESVASSAENFQEASRKRIFCEFLDPCDEAKKRRRKAEMPIPNPNHDIYHYRHVRAPAVPTSPSVLETQSQGKRAREKGSPEEQKRQRRKTCTTSNAIFSSLSSSRNLLERLTAQKRKSADLSRSSSPLTPLSGKHVRECKTVTNVKARQCSPDVAPQIRNFETVPLGDATPVSTRVNSLRVDSNVTDLGNTKEKSVHGSHHTTKSDYTTKLFRKEVSSHTPRTPSSKNQKQSLWIQPPQADELTCSLLSDESKLDRPERLKSLLARVSGKECKSQSTKTILSTPTSTETSKNDIPQVSSSSFSLPTSTSLKISSPNGGNVSSALTVTVSSTCTIMTSATVTSVNGVPSSESGRTLPPFPASPSSTSASIQAVSKNVTSSKSPETKVVALLSSGMNRGQTVSSPSSNTFASTSAAVVSQPSLLPVLSTAPSFSSSSAFTAGSGKGATEPSETSSLLKSTSDGTNQNTSASITLCGPSNPSNTFTMNSPLTGSQPSAAGLGVSCFAQTTIQFGASSTSIAPTFQFGSNIQSSTSTSTTVSSAPMAQLSAVGSQIQGRPSSISPASSSFGSNPSLSKTFSFGSNCGTSDVSKPTFQLPGSTTQPSLSVTSLHPASTVSFGSSITSPSQNAQSTFTFGGTRTNSPRPSETSKPALQFGPSVSSSNNSSTSKSAFQFGSNGVGSSSSPGVSKPAFQFGSGGTQSQVSSLPPKPSFQFGASTNENSATSQFGSIGTNINGSSKPAVSTFQFGASSQGSTVTQKSGLQLSSNTLTNQKPVPLFATPNDSTPKPAYQFGSSLSSINGTAGSSNATSQFVLNTNSSSVAEKSAFQFGSGAMKSVDSPKSTFQFSSNTNEKPSVVSPIQGSGSAFGQVASPPNKGAFTFGSTNNTNSTNENKNMFQFQSPGQASTTSTYNFGSGASPSAFGSGIQNGFAPTQNSGTSNSGAFSFGGNVPSAAGSSFQSSMMANTASNSKPFSFGSTQAQASAPAPFSLNATVMTIPNGSSQGSQSAGLFSVGSGPSSSQRRIKDARRRR